MPTSAAALRAWSQLLRVTGLVESATSTASASETVRGPARSPAASPGSTAGGGGGETAAGGGAHTSAGRRGRAEETRASGPAPAQPARTVARSTAAAADRDLMEPPSRR